MEKQILYDLKHNKLLYNHQNFISFHLVLYTYIKIWLVRQYKISYTKQAIDLHVYIINDIQ